MQRYPEKLVTLALRVTERHYVWLRERAIKQSHGNVSQFVRDMIDRKAGQQQPTGSPVTKPRRARTLLPEDFQPTSLEQWAEFGLNPAVELQSFCDHARTVGRLTADWQAAFRNWCRRSIANREERGGGKS